MNKACHFGSPPGSALLIWPLALWPQKEVVLGQVQMTAKPDFQGKIQSTSVSQSYGERLARDWNWLSQDMLSPCPDMWRQGLRYPLAVHMAQPASVGVHWAEAPWLKSLPHWASVQSLLLKEVSLSRRVDVRRNLNHPNQGSSP